MPPREIPGFYFDEARGKYFKIESRATAPPTAHWAADNVKKRARHEQRERQGRKRGRASGCPPIRRSAVAPGRCFAADALRLECEGVAGLARRAADVADARARVWSRGLGDAGVVALGEPVRRTSDFVVVTGEADRLGYIYVADRDSMGRMLAGGYVPTNHSGRICLDIEETGITGYPVDSAPGWLMRDHKLSALGYNPHKRVLFASYVPGQQGSRAPLLCLGAVDPLRPGPVVRSRLHFDNGPRDVPARPGSGAPIETYTAVSAPHNSASLCLLGTSAGAALVHDSGAWDLLEPTRRHGAIFAVDCSPLDPNLVVAGGRRGVISTTDTRSQASAAELRHGTTATHLRAAPGGSEHRVLVAGVRNTMAIYDRRWPGRAHRALPVVTFPEYHNEARVRIGWDLCAEAGVVVAAEGGGAVGLYSVASGARVGELPLGGGLADEDPVGCLRVARLGGEATPSVFVAAEGGVTKFSCGLVDDDS